MKLKKTYSFALLSALYITALSVLSSLLIHILYHKIGFTIIIIIIIIAFFLTSFFIIQDRVEYFIYRRVRKIYKDVSLLDISDLDRKSITTDIETLSESVQKFAEGKRIEIQNLTEIDSFRKDFLGNVAHELKTPLFIVQGYILTLIEGAANDRKIREKYLERANRGVERLTSIIKDLDMIAKLESDGIKMDLKPFNILDLVQDVFYLFEMRAKKKNITLIFDKTYEFPIFVLADAERIEQVLINIIGNSIKYGNKNGITSVGVDSYNQNKFIIKIADNGEGIKQEHLPRIFERFYRVNQSRYREQGGSGLGLSIVKHLIEAHNETILLKSKYGEGSEFSFTLQKAK